MRGEIRPGRSKGARPTRRRGVGVSRSAGAGLEASVDGTVPDEPADEVHLAVDLFSLEVNKEGPKSPESLFRIPSGTPEVVQDKTVFFSDELIFCLAEQGKVQLGCFAGCAWRRDESAKVEEEVVE
jgi:hypothetical protein